MIDDQGSGSIRKVALSALGSSLIFPLYYQHCFDGCNGFIWPTIVPGFHWLTVLSGGFINIFIFITFYFLFFVTFYIGQRKIESKTALWLTVIAVWAIATSILAFAKTPMKIYESLDGVIQERMVDMEKISDIKICNKYTIGTDIKSFDLNLLSEGGNILTLGMQGDDFSPDYEINTSQHVVYNRIKSVENPEVKYLYSKFVVAGRGEAEVKSDSCYLNGKENILFCFMNNKLSLKLCPIAGTYIEEVGYTMKSILEYDKKAYE